MSAFKLVGGPQGYRDTLNLKYQTPKSSSYETNSIQSSEFESSIPELTTAEEIAIKRSSATFTPVRERPDVQTPESQDSGEEEQMSHNNGDFLDNWRPSADLMMNLEGATGPRRTTGWDDDGLEITPQKHNPPVDVIPTGVRTSTPDSVANSGKLRIQRPNGKFTDLNAGNVQQSAEKRIINPLAAQSTRDFLTQMTFPDGDVQPSTSTADVNFEPVGGGKGTRTSTERSEKSRLFLPKCILLVVTVMMCLAAIVALIVTFKEDKPNGQRGHIIPDPVSYIECPDKSFNLGDDLNFTCMFDHNHAHRTALNNATHYSVIVRNKAYEKRPAKYVYSPDGVLFYKPNTKVKCSSAGTYDIEFYRHDESLIQLQNPPEPIALSIKHSQMVTTLRQRQLYGSDCLTSEFNSTCTMHNDCNNYHTEVFRMKYGREEILNQYLTCERNYTDSDGYSVSCAATFPESIVEDFVSIGCKMTQNLQNDQRMVLEKAFTIPSCTIEASCETYIPSNQNPFNCSSNSIDIARLKNATCDFPVLKACFKSGRQIFAYHKDFSGELTCSEQDTVPVCRLSWCRNYNYIIKNEIPGVAICGSFEEPSVTSATNNSTVGV